MFCECGTGSFKHVDEDPEDDIGFGGGSPKGKGRKKRRGKVNPFAERGLDRFSTVLSELESRRAKILRRVGSDTGLVMIRFVQFNGGWAPVVVKLPEDPFNGGKKRTKASVVAVQPAASNSTCTPPKQASAREGAMVNATAHAKAALARRVSFSVAMMRRPSRYWPTIIVLTLVSLAVFGRVFAICLTSIWWYLLPTVGSGSSDGAGLRRRTTMPKKMHASPQPHAEMGSSCGVDRTRL